MDNAAFEGTHPGELVRILKDVAERVVRGAVDGKLRDINGNTVGDFEITGLDDDA